MSELTFYIDIENSSGTKYGSGPLTSVSEWEYTARLDRAGSFRFSVPATDAQAGEIARKRVARAWAIVGGVWTDVGAGVIDRIVKRPQPDGRVLLEVSGDDLIRELGYRSVGTLSSALAGGPVSHSTAVSAIAGYAPAGWTITADTDPPHDEIYGRFNGESVLAALIAVGEKTQSHFYRGSGRTLIFGSSFEDAPLGLSGPGGLAPETAIITALSETIETHDLITRLYPRGAGNGDYQLALAATSRTAPAGFTLDTSAGYLEDDTAEATYGIIEQYLEYRDISPISNTDADYQAAANMLFDVALAELRRRSNEAAASYYAVALAGCSTLLRPLQRIDLSYQDADAGVDIDATLNILETTWRVDATGVQTTALQVTDAERWPQDDTTAIVGKLTQGSLYQAHPQLNANSYWENATLFVGEDQTDHVAEFPFVFGPEVVTVQQCVLRFAVKQLLSFSATVAGSSTTTPSGGGGTSSDGGGSTPTSSSAGQNHIHVVGLSSGTTGNIVYYNSGISGFNTSGGGEVETDIGSADHSHSVTIAAHSHTTPNHTHTFTPALTTTYGLYRAPLLNTYALGDLEYRVNAGSWADLDTATDAGGGYYELDITAAVADADTFRPLSENNLVEIRRTAAAGTGKTAMILAKLGVRNVVQAIAYL